MGTDHPGEKMAGGTAQEIANSPFPGVYNRDAKPWNAFILVTYEKDIIRALVVTSRSVMPRTSHTRFIIRAVAIYVTVGSGWILYSDKVMGLLLEPARMTAFSTAKGLAFVALTALALAVLLHVAPSRGPPYPAPAGSSKRTRLSVFLARLVMLCVLPLLLMAAALSVAAIDTRTVENDQAADRIAHELAHDIDKDLASRISGLEMLAGMDLPDQALYPFAQGFQRSFGSHVVVADAAEPMQMRLNTRVPFGTPLPPLPRPKGRAAAPQAVATGKPAVGDILIGPVSNKPLVAIATPVMRSGAVARVVLTTLDTAYFQDHLGWQSLPAGWALFLLDSRGERIAARLPDGWDQAAAGGPTARFTAATTLADWSVVVEMPQEIRRAPFIAAGVLLGLGVLGATAASILGGVLAGQALSRQVASLAEPPGVAAMPPIAEIAEARRRLDQAAAAIRETEERFRLLFDSAPLALAFAANDGRILTRNAHFDRLFGYSDEDLPTLERWWPLAYPDPDYRAEVMARWAASVAHARAEGVGEIEPSECWVTCKNGTRRLIQISAIALPDGLLAMFLDVTERRHAEEVLQESESKYRLLAEHAADCIVWTTPDQRIHYISPASRQVFGRSPKEFEADPGLMRSIIHPADAAAYAGHLGDQCATHAEDVEFRILLPDGSERWIAHRCWPVYDADGRSLGRHAINRDITRAKREDEERHRLSEVLRQTGVPMVIFDPGGIVSFANQAFLELTGYVADEFVGGPLSRFIPPDADSLRRHDEIREIMTQQDIWSGELTRLTRDGRPLPLLTTVSTLRDLEGKLTGYVAGYVDLRPLREQEEARRQSEERLRLFIEHAPAALAMFDRLMRYIVVSRRWCDDYGVEGRAILGRSLYDVFPEIGDGWKQAHRRAMNGETIRSAEDRFERSDGTVQWLRWEVRPWYERDGAIGGVLMFSEDITLVKEQAKALSESEARYRSILDHAADAVFITDRHGRYVYANHRAGELLGYAPEELLGLSIPDLTPAEDAEHSAATFETLKQDGHLDAELVLRRKDGRRVPVDINAIMLPDGTAYGACRDISGRRQAERQLRNLSQAIEQTPLSVIVTDLDGSIEYVNEAFTTLTGYSRDEALGRNPRILASGQTPPATYAGLWATLGGGHSWKGEFINRHKDGRTHVDFAIVSPVRNQLGEVVGYVSIQEDVTEKKRLGEELASYRRHLESMVDEKQRNANLLQRTVDRLTVANAELERIAVVAAHDLREPARAVSMYAQMLERHSGAALDEDGREFLHYLVLGAQRIYALIGGLLDYSNVPASTGELGRIASAKACDDALAELGAEIAAAGAEIVVGPLPEVIGDETQLRQVFHHLFDNAVKYRNPQRPLRVEVAAERRGALWRFTITDNGMGFDAGTQDVFELFRQLNPRSTGIGAGLAICKRILLRLGGDIRVQSQPGRGSTFTFTLPAAE